MFGRALQLEWFSFWVELFPGLREEDSKWRKKIHDRIVCVRFRKFCKLLCTNSEIIFVIREQKWLGCEQMHFDWNSKLRKKWCNATRESEKKLRHRLLFATIERKIQFDFIKRWHGVRVCVCDRGLPPSGSLAVFGREWKKKHPHPRWWCWAAERINLGAANYGPSSERCTPIKSVLVTGLGAIATRKRRTQDLQGRPAAAVWRFGGKNFAREEPSFPVAIAAN